MQDIIYNHFDVTTHWDSGVMSSGLDAYDYGGH